MYINLAISDFGKVASNFLFKEEVLSLLTVIYLWAGKALNGFLECTSKFKSPELDS